MQVETILSHTAMAAHIALQLTSHLAPSLTFISAASRLLPRAALQVCVQHGLIQELRAAVRTRLWFFIYKQRQRDCRGLRAGEDVSRKIGKSHTTFAKKAPFPYQVFKKKKKTPLHGKLMQIVNNKNGRCCNRESHCSSFF